MFLLILAKNRTRESTQTIKFIFVIMLIDLRSRHSIEDMPHERASEDNGSRSSLLAEIIDRSVTRMHTIPQYIIKKRWFSERCKAICQLFWTILKNLDRYYILDFL